MMYICIYNQKYAYKYLERLKDIINGYPNELWFKCKCKYNNLILYCLYIYTFLIILTIMNIINLLGNIFGLHA